MVKNNLLIQALFKIMLGFVSMCLLLFVPAGTWKFWNAWLLIIELFVPIMIVGVVLWFKDKELLKKRLNSKENETEQKTVVIMSGLVFVIGFIMAGLDFRFNWTNMPLWLVVFGAILLPVSYGLFVEVLRENAYLSRTVEIQENHKVVDTGLYGIVRHPMYSATTILFMSFPIILNSWISFGIFLLYIYVLVRRIKNEEKVLEEGLDGYIEYKEKVRYRLIPFVW